MCVNNLGNRELGQNTPLLTLLVLEVLPIPAIWLHGNCVTLTTVAASTISMQPSLPASHQQSQWESWQGRLQVTWVTVPHPAIVVPRPTMFVLCHSGSLCTLPHLPDSLFMSCNFLLASQLTLLEAGRKFQEGPCLSLI